MIKSFKLSKIFIFIFFSLQLFGDINLYTHRHYSSDKILFQRFTETTGIKINVIKGSADQLIQRLLNEGDKSPADILLTVDAGRLARAKELKLLQPISSLVLEKQVPKSMRDEDGYWFGLTVRTRAIIYSKKNVKPIELSTYEDLVIKKWNGRIVIGND